MPRCGIANPCNPSRTVSWWFSDCSTATLDVPVILRRLVDAEWYVVAYADVGMAGAEPVDHYFRHGRYEGRKPNRYFDPPFYAAEAAGHGLPINGDLLAHYVSLGERANLRPSMHFDPAWYRATYRIEAETNCLDHFLRRRVSGQVSPNRDFDARHYLAENPDVAALGRDPFEHWVAQGQAEGRLPMAERQLVLGSGLFDENHYLISAGDVFGASLDGVDHFLASGWSEGRSPNPYFDTAWYAARHPDRPYRNPLTEYVLRGEAADQSPGPLFDTGWYRRAYALPSGSSPLRHWLEHRRTQLFSPLPHFDPLSYVAEAGERLRPHHDPFLHALATQAVQRRTGPAAE